MAWTARRDAHIVCCAWVRNGARVASARWSKVLFGVLDPAVKWLWLRRCLWRLRGVGVRRSERHVRGSHPAHCEGVNERTYSVNTLP